MAITASKAFEEFRRNLEITPLQSATVSSRQQNVRNVVAAGFIVLSDFQTGSYSRSTMIAPLSEADVDIFFVLDPQHFQNYNGKNGGPAGLLDSVKRTLQRTYTRTPDISRNGQAVSVRFTDFVVDVVPGFNRQGGGYLIPDAIGNRWLETDPRSHVELISDSNKAHNGDLVPLIKMIKGWNKNSGSFFRSFHLEVLALSILNNISISNYPSGIRYFFEQGQRLISEKNPDPAGYGDDVGRYIDNADKVRDAINRFQTAYERAARAEGSAARGQSRDAIDTWGKLFGSYFPTYG